MITVVNDLHADRMIKSTDYYRCNGKFITVLLDGNEVMYLFNHFISHAEQLQAVKLLNPKADIKLVSTGFCEFDSYEAETDENCIPLFATGPSTSIQDVPHSRNIDTLAIPEYVSTLNTCQQHWIP